jgi:hypothetical protein
VDGMDSQIICFLLWSGNRSEEIQGWALENYGLLLVAQCRALSAWQ